MTFGKNVEEIGASAFYGCDSLVFADLGEKVSSIGSSAFEGCKSLKTVNISENVKLIRDYTFRGCTSLESVTGFAAVDSIRFCAFYECKSLRAITLPATVQEVGMWAFYGAGLKKLTFSDSSTPLTLRHYNSYSYSSPFYGCPIDSLYIGRDISHTNRDYSYAPYNSSLKDVVIGDQVTKISKEAFGSCKQLKKVTLGENVEDIGASAFYGCDSLQMVRAYWQIPLETPDNTFSNTNYKNATLYIPGGTLAAYQTTSCWKNFLNIQSMQYEVKLTATTGGCVRVNDGEAVTGTTQSFWIDRKASVTFDFEAEEDYNLESVIVNGDNVTDQLVDGQLKVASLENDMTITATFASKTRYSVTASVVTLGGGATEGSLDSLEHVVTGVGGIVAVADSIVVSGQSTTVTIIANEGYELKSVTVNGEDKTAEVVDSVLTLTDIREDKAVVATFQKQRFTISAVHGEGGSISLSATTVEWGDSVTAIVTADEGYEVATLKVGSEDISASVAGKKKVTCNIQCVTEDIVVSATFKVTFAIIELTSDGERTYCCNHDLDFSQTNEIRAYIASGYYPQTGYVLLTRVLEVPAGTGIVVRGEEGTYKIPSGESSAYYLNLLKGNLEPVTVEPIEGDLANLCLMMGTDGLGFYPVTTAYMMDANSARLQLPAYLLGGESCVKIAYEEDADAVRAAIGTQEDAPVYDLSGRQIVNSKSLDSKLRRGIYIRNGKKVMIK